jgi:hypothetical protein
VRGTDPERADAFDGIETDNGSRYLIEEWEYPDVGVVIAYLPSGGHDTRHARLLRERPDRRAGGGLCRRSRIPRRIAPSFEAFLAGLRPCSEFPD